MYIVAKGTPSSAKEVYSSAKSAFRSESFVAVVLKGNLANQNVKYSDYLQDCYINYYYSICLLCIHVSLSSLINSSGKNVKR